MRCRGPPPRIRSQPPPAQLMAYRVWWPRRKSMTSTHRMHSTLGSAGTGKLQRWANAWIIKSFSNTALSGAT